MCSTDGGVNECWDPSNTAMPAHCYAEPTGDCFCDNDSGWFGDGTGACVQACVGLNSPAIGTSNNECWGILSPGTFWYDLSAFGVSCIYSAITNDCTCDSSSDYVPMYTDVTAFNSQTALGTCHAACTSSDGLGSYCYQQTSGSTLPTDCYYDDTDGMCECDDTNYYVGSDIGTCKKQCSDPTTPNSPNDCWAALTVGTYGLDRELGNGCVVADSDGTCSCDAS